MFSPQVIFFISVAYSHFGASVHLLEHKLCVDLTYINVRFIWAKALIIFVVKHFYSFGSETFSFIYHKVTAFIDKSTKTIDKKIISISELRFQWWRIMTSLGATCGCHGWRRAAMRGDKKEEKEEDKQMSILYIYIDVARQLCQR